MLIEKLRSYIATGKQSRRQRYDDYPPMGVVTCELCGCAVVLRAYKFEGDKDLVRVHWDRFHRDEMVFDKYRRDFIGDAMFEDKENARHRFAEVVESGIEVHDEEEDFKE